MCVLVCVRIYFVCLLRYSYFPCIWLLRVDVIVVVSFSRFDVVVQFNGVVVAVAINLRAVKRSICSSLLFILLCVSHYRSTGGGGGGDGGGGGGGCGGGSFLTCK